MLRVALGGPMASGKSTVGWALSARLGVPFVDLDGEIEPATTLFTLHGEARFRDEESAALRRVTGGDGVIALGGGTLVREENRRLLSGWTVVILMASRDTLRARMEGSVGRPLGSRWEQLLEERAPTWAAYGPPVSTDALDVERVVDEVLARC